MTIMIFHDFRCSVTMKKQNKPQQTHQIWPFNGHKKAFLNNSWCVLPGIITVLFASIMIGGYAPTHLSAEVGWFLLIFPFGKGQKWWSRKSARKYCTKKYVCFVYSSSSIYYMLHYALSVEWPHLPTFFSPTIFPSPAMYPSSCKATTLTSFFLKQLASVGDPRISSDAAWKFDFRRF